MLFNTIDFIIFFIVVLTILYAAKNRKFQHIFLLSASYFFFYYTSNYLITLLIFTTIWDFYFGKAIWKTNIIKQKKILLILSLAGNLGLLGFFKYADFAITQFNIIGEHFDLNTIPLMNLALPIGISFYTFHSITYTVGIYRGIIEPVRLREYALFVVFFPQLVAGPILRAKDFLPQLRERFQNKEIGIQIKQILIANSNLKLGITMMAIGFFKKMFIADNISPMVNALFNYPLGRESFTIIIGTISFGVQIYSDFSGYSDIAIGASLIMGFKIPMNFNKPYFAISPSDFWKRWHISLSTWLRDYLYIPLGGNRKSKPRTYFNLMVVMFLGGLWHGASWNLILWGILHGVYLMIHKFITDQSRRFGFSKTPTRLVMILSIIITQYFVFLAWIPFRVSDTSYLWYCIYKYIILDFQTTGTTQFILSNKMPIFLILFFFVIHFVSYKKGSLFDSISQLNNKYWFLFLLGIATSILFFYNGNPEQFLYFKF